MAVQVSHPGVYIEEFSPGAPIEGVGTNTAAFIGPAARGDLDTPTKITSWDAFKATFGDEPLPGFYLWYAVRGFFENGGQVCYVVRASNGRYAEATVNDQSSSPGLPLFRLRAHMPGAPAPAIQAKISPSASVLKAPLFQPTASYTIDGVQAVKLDSAADAAQFRPGDWVRLEAPDTRVEVVSVSGPIVRVATPLSGAINAGSMTLVDAPAGTRTFRLAPASPLAPGVLVPGSMLIIAQPPNSTGDAQIVESVQVEQLATSPKPTTTYRVTLRQGLGIGIAMNAAAAVAGVEFDVAISQGGPAVVHNNLSVDPSHPRYYVDVINNGPAPVRVDLIEPSPGTRMPANVPAFTTVTLQQGLDEDLATLGDADYTEALDTLRIIDDVNLIAIPDRPTVQVQQALVAHCEQLADRFAVLDARPGLAPFSSGNSNTQGIDGQRQGLDSTRGYAALYYPWLRVAPTRGGRPILVPPSGHVTGIIARSDASRGVHKAPANELVNGALGLERMLSDAEQGQLNLAGINVLRIFQAGGRPTLWGARTTATDKNWLHVSTRRLFLFLEESIQEGIRWAIFEPNNKSLWEKLKRTITEFLTRVWRDGALFGTKAEEAFYVRIDDALNPFSEQALGRLHIEIGVRPTYPAEFIVVRIGIWPGGSVVSEG